MHVLQDKEHEQTRDELKRRGIFTCVRYIICGVRDRRTILEFVSVCVCASINEQFIVCLLIWFRSPAYRCC